MCKGKIITGPQNEMLRKLQFHKMPLGRCSKQVEGYFFARGAQSPPIWGNSGTYCGLL